MKASYLALLLFGLFSCSNEEKPRATDETKTRSFHMGFTAFPYAGTLAAQSDT